MTSPAKLHRARSGSSLLKGTVVLGLLSLVGWLGYCHFVKSVDISSQLNAAAALEAKGQHDSAIKAYELVLALDPRNVRAKEAIDRIKAGMQAVRDHKEARTNAQAGESTGGR